MVGGADPRFFTWEYLGAISTLKSRDQRGRVRWDRARQVRVEDVWRRNVRALGGTVGFHTASFGTGPAHNRNRFRDPFLSPSADPAPQDPQDLLDAMLRKSFNANCLAPQT